MKKLVIIFALITGIVVSTRHTKGQFSFSAGVSFGVVTPVTYCAPLPQPVVYYTPAPACYTTYTYFSNGCYRTVRRPCEQQRCVQAPRRPTRNRYHNNGNYVDDVYWKSGGNNISNNVVVEEKRNTTGGGNYY